MEDSTLNGGSALDALVAAYSVTGDERIRMYVDAVFDGLVRCASFAEAQGFVDFELQQIENEKWKRWILLLKETKEIIGTCLVFYNDDENENHWDISYNLGKKYWGKGYTTEAMKAVMKFAETELGMKECITTYAKVNNSSANVLHKLGFQDEKDISYECSGGDIITDGILCRYVATQK